MIRRKKSSGRMYGHIKGLIILIGATECRTCMLHILNASGSGARASRLGVHVHVARGRAPRLPAMIVSRGPTDPRRLRLESR